MATKSKTLQVIVKAKNMVKATFSSVRKGLESVGEVGKKVALGITAVFAAVGGGLAYVVSKTLESTDGLAKTADKLGITTEALSAMRHAAALAGMSTKELDTSLQYLERNIGDAAQGTGEGKKAFEALGLSIEDLKAAGPEKAFSMVVERLGQVKDATNRTNYAMDIFGRNGTGVLNLTAEGLAEAKREANELGLAMNRTDARKIEEANDAITRMKGGFKGATQALTVALAPAITSTFKAITDKIKSLAGNGDLKVWATKSALAIVQSFQQVIRVVGGAGEAVLGFGRVLNFVYGNAIKLVGGFSRGQIAHLEAELKQVEHDLTQYGKNPVFKVGSERHQRDLQLANDIRARVADLKITEEAAYAIAMNSEEQGEKLKNLQGQIVAGANRAADSLGKQVTEIERQVQAAVRGKNAMDEYAKASELAKSLTTELSAVENETSALDLLIEKQRTLNQEAGRSGGSFNVVESSSKIDELTVSQEKAAKSAGELVENQEAIGPAAQRGVGQAGDVLEAFISRAEEARYRQKVLNQERYVFWQYTVKATEAQIKLNKAMAAGPKGTGSLGDLEQAITDAERTE